ncbi:enoyl-CoA delta isomerase 2, mitochondrial-like [Thrips palmi]|uniref:Enoyl-CoA delta isomerase 2, mitochondrial-like n=1 Tax=Thrips palmi TaxID=161013 RepID=A0A6P8ZZB2_THRPL|nr:enoyl-CoA delta isomerase 2, mitochondrial-like [Thrips palmi]XP_034250768.1 enoyl-CoA delta isomerase 2, mitochondrial-like [Thrips palmi]XP_034250769.1 enoyl-CoA delta isomerase 2, mitochondrial-like [Thrips palmi]XP_034250770.1 enoyl-CoA delta isomerase 2, mitochondrial-like [Thrips palmi]
MSQKTYQTLAVTVQDGVQVIRLNRPEKRNAINQDMYREIPEALLDGALNNDVVVTVITGSGSYYCSGNDLSGYLSWSGSDLEKTLEQAAAILRTFVQSFIDFPKILVGVVNGPAVGLATTTLALFDVVYCANNATFSTPFTALGLTPEGCSSYTFPKLLGPLRAAQLLSFGKVLSSAEALNWGFVSEVYAPTDENEIWKRIHALAQLPSKSLIYGKRLLRSQDRAALYEANRKECEQLVERWQSEDCMNAVSNFFSAKRSKL